VKLILAQPRLANLALQDIRDGFDLIIALQILFTQKEKGSRGLVTIRGCLHSFDLFEAICA